MIRPIFRRAAPASGLILLLVSPLLAGPPSPGEVGNPQITAPEIVAHIRYLASDELRGRASGTHENDLAADYIASRFKAAGLRPAGEGGTWFQRFPVAVGLKLGPDNQITVLQGTEPRDLKLEAEFMPASFSKKGTLTAALVFAGYGISQPELKYDDYAGIDVKGKVVVVLRHTPDNDDSGKFGPYAPLTYKTLTAREKGAAGILFITGPLGDQPETLPKPSLGQSSSTDAGILAAFVKRDVAEKLVAPAGHSLQELQVELAHGSPRSFVIPDARISIRTDVERQTAPTRNVLGYLEGSDPKLKNEVIVIGAHYDHLGMGGEHSLDTSGKPAIHHGADDNASGTAGVLELAQYFAANRKKLGRSLLFMSFSGEEIGLLGSDRWTKQPTIPLVRVAAMINMDMIGRLHPDADNSHAELLSVIGAGSSPAWKPLLESANRGFGFKLQTGGSSGFGGSDQQSFYAKGIPVLFFFTGVHADYHKPSDTWDKINGPGEVKVVELVAETARRISWLKPRPQFTRSKDQEQSPGGGGFRVYLGTIPNYGAEVEGVLLDGVREGSPAEKGGIKGGDILVEFDGKKIRNVEEYSAILGGARPNVPVKLVVLRGGQRLTLEVTPLSRN